MPHMASALDLEPWPGYRWRRVPQGGEGQEPGDLAGLGRAEPRGHQEGGKPYTTPKGVDQHGGGQGHRQPECPQDQVGLEPPKRPAEEVARDGEGEAPRLSSVEVCERGVHMAHDLRAPGRSQETEPLEHPPSGAQQPEYLDCDETPDPEKLEAE